jgi:DNA-binding NtrC family response regulator
VPTIQSCCKALIVADFQHSDGEAPHRDLAAAGQRKRHADFRLICTTHQNLAARVAEGRFRQDLYYRINVFPLRVPSLTERIEDLPQLVRALLRSIDPQQTLMQRHNGDREQVAAIAGISVRSLYRKLSQPTALP